MNTFRTNRADYLATLLRRANTPDANMRKSLLAWASACTPAQDGSTAGQRVSLGRVIEALPQRLIPVSSAAPIAVFERNGFAIKDVPLMAVDLSGCVILPGSAVFCDGTLFAQDFRSCPHAWQDIGWYMRAEEIGFSDYDICNNTALIDVSPHAGTLSLSDFQGYFFFVSNYSGGNFGHFVHDTLGQLAAYERACEVSGRKLIPILSREFQFPMQRFLFEKLIGPTDEVVYLPSHPVSVGTCFGATRPMPAPGSGEISVHAFRYLRRRILEMKGALKSGGALSVPKLYISRADATGGGRKFANLPEVEDLLRSRDFVFVTISKLTPDQMLDVFDDCAVIAGVHGAGLLNAFLTGRDARVLEFADYPKSWESIPSVLLAAGFDHVRLLAQAPEPGTGNLPLIDLSRLTQVLN